MKKIFFCFLLVTAALAGCKKSIPVDNNPHYTMPVIITDSVIDITRNSAVCVSTLSSNGSGIVFLSKGVFWDIAPHPDAASHASTDSTRGNFNDTITNLQPATTYYIRAFADYYGGGLFF